MHGTLRLAARSNACFQLAEGHRNTLERGYVVPRAAALAKSNTPLLWPEETGAGFVFVCRRLNKVIGRLESSEQGDRTP